MPEIQFKVRGRVFVISDTNDVETIPSANHPPLIKETIQDVLHWQDIFESEFAKRENFFGTVTKGE